jgi:hypothetical protein
VRRILLWVLPMCVWWCVYRTTTETVR